MIFRTQFWSKWREVWRKEGGRKVLFAIPSKLKEDWDLAMVVILSEVHQLHGDVGIPAQSKGSVLSPFCMLLATDSGRIPLVFPLLGSLTPAPLEEFCP